MSATWGPGGFTQFDLDAEYEEELERKLLEETISAAKDRLRAAERRDQELWRMGQRDRREQEVHPSEEQLPALDPEYQRKQEEKRRAEERAAQRARDRERERERARSREEEQRREEEQQRAQRERERWEHAQREAYEARERAAAEERPSSAPGQTGNLEQLLDAAMKRWPARPTKKECEDILRTYKNVHIGARKKVYRTLTLRTHPDKGG